MATKAVKVDIDKESFLDDLNPVTPNFGAPAPNPEAESESASRKRGNVVLPKHQSDYESVFLAPAGGGKKTWRVYITEKHFERINTIVKRLSPEGQQQSIVGYLWNVLEEHFKTHGKTIAALIDKTVQTNPFDEFK